MSIRLPECICLRCGRRWIPRVPDPAVCPSCNSARWKELKTPRFTIMKRRTIQLHLGKE